MKLYRLGQLAATIASGIEDLANRRATADPGALLLDLALFHTVTERLTTSIENGDEVPLWLAGVARSEYTRCGVIELVSLGAHPWETASGYSGVSGVFYNTTHNRFFELGGGRPDRSLNPLQVYKSQIGWIGGHTLETMSGQRVTVSDALVNAKGRLSTSSRTSAALSGYWTPDQLAKADWDGSMPVQASRLRGIDSTRWASLKLDKTGPAVFDEITQRLVWPVYSAGQDVVVTIRWTALNAGMVEAVEQLASHKPSHIIGRLWVERGQIHLSPISAVVRDHLRVLGFDQPVRKAPNLNEGNRPDLTGGVNRSLERIGSRLLHLAERGVDESVSGLLTEIGEDASARGFGLIGRLLGDVTVSPSARLLRAAHVVDEHRHHRD